MDWSQCEAVWRDPERMGGVWCFRDTRMPVADLFSHLDEGVTVDEFLDWFPAVNAEQVHAVLAFARRSLDVPVAAA